MILVYKKVHAWPKLTWVAVFSAKTTDRISVYHGTYIETNDRWCVEAVWAGEFSKGDFDHTDLVFGSGIRCRREKAMFVSSGTGVDHLVYCHHHDFWYVSNSLPALLACAELSLREDYLHYTDDIYTVEKLGIRQYKRSLPTNSSDINIIYFNNLLYDGQSLREVDKPNTAPHFVSFQDYYDFLTDTAGRLGSNLSSPIRHYNIVPLASISSGYDSTAATIISKHAGCTQAVTIKQSTSYWRGSDSGATIARYLNISCKSYDRVPKVYPHEVAIWAATGKPGGLNLTVFDYPEPLSLFFSGSYGDNVWDRAYHDLSEPVGDVDCFLGEFRLFKGMFHCVVPWWGIKHVQEIHAINFLQEMEPWVLHTSYDRPIARRIVEEAGVPRAAFAIRKKNTSSNVEFYWPHSPESKDSFAKYLRSRGLYVPSSPIISLIGHLAHMGNLISMNVTPKLSWKKSLRQKLKFKANSLLFHWANAELKQYYRMALEKSGFSITNITPY